MAVCVECTHVVTSRQQAIECDGCKRCWHRLFEQQRRKILYRIFLCLWQYQHAANISLVPTAYRPTLYTQSENVSFLTLVNSTRVDTCRVGVWTLRHQDTSAPVPKVSVGHFGTDHRGSHACQRQQLRSGRGGELKAVDVYVPLSLNCGFWSQLSGATVRSQLLWRMLRVIIITVMV